MLGAGIRRLVIGHTPSGDLPVILRTPDDAFEVVVADTSRSAAPETPALISLEGADLDTVNVQGQLQHGGAFTQVSLTARLGQATALGKRTADGALVVAPTSLGYYTYQLQPGWKVVYDLADTV